MIPENIINEPHEGGWSIRQGVGIAPADQQRLFERFFRAHSAAEIPGTGLGLYIIAKYLELMGGRIALVSELGVGTTFTVTVPYAHDSAA